MNVWREAAQAQIDEPVIDACLFARQSSYAASAAASHGGALGGMILRKSRVPEARLGGGARGGGGKQRSHEQRSRQTGDAHRPAL